MKTAFINALIKTKYIFIACFTGSKEFLVYCFMLLCSLWAPYKAMMIFVFLLAIIDWIFAIVINARKNNLQSAKVKNFVGKVCFYAIAFLISGGFDKFIGIELLGSVITSAILISEALSLLANCIIVFPHIPIIPKLKKWLDKELERKLGDYNDEEN